MNHDYSHCLDFNDSCPMTCFRAELVRDLRSRKDMVGVPISWTHYKNTDECPKVEMKEYIFEIEEEEIDEAEVFFGWIRKHSHELIRCKDCLWHYGTICRRNNTMFWNDDGFCSYAEREEYEAD